MTFKKTITFCLQNMNLKINYWQNFIEYRVPLKCAAEGWKFKVLVHDPHHEIFCWTAYTLWLAVKHVPPRCLAEQCPAWWGRSDRCPGKEPLHWRYSAERQVTWQQGYSSRSSCHCICLFVSFEYSWCCFFSLNGLISDDISHKAVSSTVGSCYGPRECAYDS